MKANLNVPYFSQLDNKLNPYGTCNTTCVAMAMAFRGIKGDGSGQLEDQLTAKCNAEGWDRHSPWDLQKLFKWKKLKSEFDPKSNREKIKNHLKNGPVIVHGYFTRSGHIILIKGFDDTAYNGRGAFVVNDPNGEWHADGYTYQEGAGNGALYSYAMIDRLCSPDGDFWAHYC